ncbi:hypothetical protein ACROYT_G031074 [Oculina patagonica]
MIKVSDHRMSKTKEKKRAWESSSTSSTGEEEDVSDAMILEKLSSIHEDIKALKEELKGEIRAVKSELSEVTKSLTAVWEEVQSLKERNKNLQDQCDSAERENSKLNQEISTLKNRLIKLEDYSRRENLRFYNIPENPGESNAECSRKVMDVLTELGAETDNIMFHAIHRTGNPNTTASSNRAANNEDSTESREEASRPPRPRPILVRFVSRMDCDWIWQSRKRLMNSSSFSSVFIDKDLSPESAKERGKLRAAYKKAKELNVGRVFIKAKGAIIRSRATWYEKGEKSNKYFLGLESHRGTKSCIRRLFSSDGRLTTNPTKIIKEIEKFYSDLYASNDESVRNHPFLQRAEIPKLSDEMRRICEGRLSLKECFDCLQSFQNNKSPGNDGLTVEFYKTFWNSIRNLVVDCLNYSYECGELSNTQKQAIITLIEKKGKDKRNIGNWRPISLINVDAKIGSKAIALRLQKVLAEIIHFNQNAYVKGRTILDAVRTIDDILEYTERKKD